MSNVTSFVKHGDPISLVCAGDMPWRILAQCDDEGLLAGNCWIRTPEHFVIEGFLSDYRRLRGMVPREIYMALRQLKNTYEAEQAGMRGRA